MSDVNGDTTERNPASLIEEAARRWPNDFQVAHQRDDGKESILIFRDLAMLEFARGTTGFTTGVYTHREHRRFVTVQRSDSHAEVAFAMRDRTATFKRLVWSDALKAALNPFEPIITIAAPENTPNEDA